MKKAGSYGYLFVDDTLSVPVASLNLYSEEFDTMYRVLAENLGTFVDRDDNGKVAILLYDINDGGSVYGYLGGYFWSKDYYADSLTRQQGIRSNEMDVIYIRGDKPSGWDQATSYDFYEYNLTTLVHEYQHLVHFGRLVWTSGGTSSDVWIDEMMSMAAETMYFKEKLNVNPLFTHPDMLTGGYLKGRIEYYNQDPKSSIRNGHGLTYWNSSDYFANYSLSYLFGQYLSLQASNGQGIFKAILDYMANHSQRDYQAVVSASAPSLLAGISSWEDLLKNWAVANFVNSPSGPSGYKGAFTLSAHGPTSNPVYIYNSGIVYRQIYDVWTPPVDAGTNIRFYLFDESGAFIGTTTTTIPASTTTTTASSVTTTTTIPATTTTTITDAACPDPAFPHDCLDVTGGCCPEGYPVCCYFGCCPESFPYCGSDGFCHDTPQDGQGPCPAELLLEGDAHALRALRLYRDKVLLASPRGEPYVRLFYRHAPELHAILLRRQDFRQRAALLLAQLLPALRNTERMQMGDKMLEDMLTLCNELSLQGSPALRDDMLKLLQEIKNESLLESLGLSVEQETAD